MQSRLQGSALFRTGDRQRVLAAVEGKLDETLRATVLLMTCERRDENNSDWHWVCDLTIAAMEGVTPRGPGLLLRRRASGGGARIAQPDGYVPLTLESAELDELYDVRIAAGCDEVHARAALTPAVIAWLCERAPGGPGGRDGRGQRATRDGGTALLGRGAGRVQRRRLLARARIHRRRAGPGPGCVRPVRSSGAAAAWRPRRRPRTAAAACPARAPLCRSRCARGSRSSGRSSRSGT